MPKNRHERKLVKSRADVVTLGYEVEYRYLKLCKDHLQALGVPLAVPKELHTDFVIWREMRVRHKCVSCNGVHLSRVMGTEHYILDRKSKLPHCAECGGVGDYRHRASELTALENVARWTLVVKGQLTGKPTPEWEGIER